MLSDTPSRLLRALTVGWVIAVCGAAPAAARPGCLVRGSVTISPAAGTPDASPETQISILGSAPSRIRSVRVIGSVSGVHSGRLRAYSGARGASYVLGRGLDPGERVHVRIAFTNRSPIRFSFTVARLAPNPPALNIPGRQPSKLQRFVSEPGLLPPKITVLRPAPRLGGDIFLAPTPSPVVHPESNNAISIKPVGPGGPMIIDGRGRLVWFHQLRPPLIALDFRPQRFAGRTVLTWWQGVVTAGAFGEGVGEIADASYRVQRTVRTGNGYAADVHEFLLTPSGDALFTAYSPVLVHLPGTPAPSLSLLLDAIVQQVDVRTGLVVWEWHAYGHIPLAQSYATPANSAYYDAFHINSIQPLSGGRILISARDTSAIYMIDRHSGSVLWTLGGKASTFRLTRGARFWFQHDAHMVGTREVAMFDDEAGPPFKAASSRGLILRLDTRRQTATVAREYRVPGQGRLAESEGNLQLLPGGGAFIGFGAEPFFSEFSARGAVVFDARLPVDDGTYRALRFPWSGSPTTRPSVAVTRTWPGRTAVYVSWNGATGVARWEVMAGSRAGALRPRVTVAKHGFETRIDVSGSFSRLAVRALDAAGRVLSTSGQVRAS